MFTGIIREPGRVKTFAKSRSSYHLSVESACVHEGAQIGDSVAVNGVCLTLVRKAGAVMHFDVMDQTVRRSTLGSLGSGDSVNLENALAAGDPIGGHFVQGHVDCVGEIHAISKTADSVSIDIKFPEEFEQYIVEKGSVAIDGISLTVGKINKSIFTVHVIPHTLNNTTLASKRAGDKLNLEFDMLGKYVQKKVEISNRKAHITESFLKEKGFG